MNKVAAQAARRRPRQTRSRTTAEAIAEAFLQLLVEQGYTKVSIRQIVGVAGVGIGSFYEYYASKTALAAVCVHLKIKGVAQQMKASIDATRELTLPARVEALIAAQLEAPLAQPEQWAAIFAIERQVSSPEVYQRAYAEFVGLWQACLCAAPDGPDERAAQQAAMTSHAIAYGLASQTLLSTNQPFDTTGLRQQIRLAVHGYLSVVVPRAYRFHAIE